MALLKYLRGKAANIDTTTTPFHDGYVYFTTDEGKMYVDCNTGTDAAPNNQRIPVNAENANKLGNIAAAEYATLTALAAKADKKIPSAAGNLATLDANGNLADGGKAVAALEPFVITATRGTLTDGSYPITHDKTLAEISAAYQANKRIVVSLTSGSMQTMFELSTVTFSTFFVFSAWYTMDGVSALDAWLQISEDYGGYTGNLLPILSSGGTMEGDLTLAADPTAALGAATKQYVDAGDAAKLGTSGDGSNVTAAFTQATSRANIATGEKLSVILGKIMKWFADLGTAAFVGTSATPASDGTTVFTTGGAYTQLAAKQATTNSLTAETALADADYVPFYDASASAHRKTLWSNIKAVLKTYFDTLYALATHTHTKSQITDFPTSMTPTAHAASHASGGADVITPAAIGAAELDTNSKVMPVQASAAIVSVSAAKTLALSDAGSFQLISSASAVTVTVPLNSAAAFPTGTEIELFRAGAGTVTVAFASGITVWCSSATYTIADQYTSVCLKKLGTDTWALQGNVG